MKERMVAQKRILDEMGQERAYDYAILVDEVPVARGFSCESYGVAVREQGGEGERVPHITVSAGRIKELMELLVRNTVTPCTLRDVVDDWL